VRTAEQFELTLLRGLDAASEQLWSTDSNAAIDRLARQVSAPPKAAGKARQQRTPPVLSPTEILVRGLLPLACWRPRAVLPTAITPSSPKSLLSTWKLWRRSPGRQSLFHPADEQEPTAPGVKLAAASSTATDRTGEAAPRDIFEHYAHRTMLQNQEYLDEARRGREEMDQFTLLQARAARQVLLDHMSILEVGVDVVQMLEAHLATLERQTLKALYVLAPAEPGSPLLISLGPQRISISSPAGSLPGLGGFAYVNFMAPDVLQEIGRRLPTKYEAFFTRAAELGLHRPFWHLSGLDEKGEEVFDYSYRVEGAQGDWGVEGGHICPFGGCRYTDSGNIERACVECQLAGARIANYFSMIMQYASGAEREVVITETREERTYLYNPAGRTPAEREKTREVAVRRLERASRP